MSIIKKTLDAYALSSNRAFATDRMNTVGASEVGQCARKIFWVKNEDDTAHGAPRDEGYVDSWGARARGTIFENHFWEPALRERFGERLKFAGAEQKTFMDGFLSATPDGMVVDLTPEERAEIGVDTDCANFECKTSDPRTNLTEAKGPNVFQTQVQMGMIREGTEYRPTHAILSYTDASFWSDVKEFVIPFDPALYETAKQRAVTIMTATNAADLKPEGWIAGGKECNYCPFTKACGIERRNLPFQDIAPVDPQFAEEITQLARQLKVFEAARDGCDQSFRDLQETIKARLREKNVKKIPGVVSWSPVKGRAGYDNKAIKQAAIDAGVDISKFETQGEPSDKLVIQIGASDDASIPGTAPAAPNFKRGTKT
jgi:hypothetical protein